MKTLSLDFLSSHRTHEVFDVDANSSISLVGRYYPYDYWSYDRGDFVRHNITPLLKLMYLEQQGSL